MKRKTVFSQLWIEEEENLCKWGSSLKDNAVIVEIGTAQGGSAYLLATSASEKNISIYSYDISPSQEAFDNLKGLKVNIIKSSSVEGAIEWPKGANSPIDLLFIDGSHTLENVHSDFISWFPYVKIGGIILFHDYDPVPNGGSSHLGVKVFIDALTKQDAVEKVDQAGRLFCVRKGKDNIDNEILIEDCYRVWNDLKRNISEFIRFNYQGCNYFGSDKNYLSILKELRGLWGTKVGSLDKVSDDKKVLIISQSLSVEQIKNAHQQKIAYILDDLAFFYMIDDSIKNKRDKVLEITKNRNMFYKWEELLEMHDHSRLSPEKGQLSNYQNKNISDISRILAFELVKINILKNIYFSIIGSI